MNRTEFVTQLEKLIIEAGDNGVTTQDMIDELRVAAEVMEIEVEEVTAEDRLHAFYESEIAEHGR